METRLLMKIIWNDMDRCSITCHSAMKHEVVGDCYYSHYRNNNYSAKPCEQCKGFKSQHHFNYPEVEPTIQPQVRLYVQGSIERQSPTKGDC